MDSIASQTFQNLSVECHDGNIFVITLNRGQENKLNAPFCQEIIHAYHSIQRALVGTNGGAVITRGSNDKFWCTGLELEDPDPWMSADGFYPVSSHIVFKSCASFSSHCSIASRMYFGLSVPNSGLHHRAYVWGRLSVCVGTRLSRHEYR